MAMLCGKQRVNIPRHVVDEFHRYQMPILHVKVEGRGNGIKTQLPNIHAIALSLDRPLQCTIVSI